MIRELLADVLIGISFSILGLMWISLIAAWMETSLKPTRKATFKSTFGGKVTVLLFIVWLATLGMMSVIVGLTFIWDVFSHG